MINKRNLILVATIFSIIALLFWFMLPAITGSFSSLLIFRYFSFFSVTFGDEGIRFSFLNLIPFLFLIATIVLNILNFLNIDIFKKGKIDITFTAVLSLIAAAGLLSVVPFTAFTNNLTDQSLINLGSGAVLTSIFAILSAAILFATKIFNK